MDGKALLSRILARMAGMVNLLQACDWTTLKLVLRRQPPGAKDTGYPVAQLPCSPATGQRPLNGARATVVVWIGESTRLPWNGSSSSKYRTRITRMERILRMLLRRFLLLSALICPISVIRVLFLSNLELLER